MEKTTRRWAWPLAIFLLAVGFRIAYVILGGEFQPSAGLGAEMERAGATLATKGYLGDVFPGIEGPSAHVAPLYPTILALIYSLFGVGTLAGTLVQTSFAILITAMTAALLPMAGIRLGLGTAPGQIAGLALALSPLNLWLETSGSWEQPLAGLVLLGLLLGFSAVSSSREWRFGPALLGLGVLYGFAALLSPGLIPAGLLIILGEFLLRKDHRAQIIRASLILGVLGVIITGPWIFRNYRAFDAFIPVRGNFGLELAMGHHDEANGRTFAIAWDDPDDPIHRLHPNGSASEQARLQELGERGYMAEKLQTAVTWIRENPGRTAELTASRFFLFWFPPPGLWSASSRGRVLKSTLLRALSFFMFGGLAVLWARKHPFRVHLSAIVFGPSLIYMVTHVYPRYGCPAQGISMLIGAYFAVALVFPQFKRIVGSPKLS